MEEEMEEEKPSTSRMELLTVPAVVAQMEVLLQQLKVLTTSRPVAGNPAWFMKVPATEPFDPTAPAPAPAPQPDKS